MRSFIRHYLQRGCLEIRRCLYFFTEWRFFERSEPVKLCSDFSNQFVMLKMFSLTDIQPGPTDIGEILVKVSIFVIQGLTRHHSAFTLTKRLLIFPNVSFFFIKYLFHGTKRYFFFSFSQLCTSAEHLSVEQLLFEMHDFVNFLLSS